MGRVEPRLPLRLARSRAGLRGEGDGVPPTAILEERGGYVDPYDLVAAQNAAAGGTVVGGAVHGLRALPRTDGGGVALCTASRPVEDRFFHLLY